MLGKTNAVSGKQKYGAYNIEQVEVDGGVAMLTAESADITDLVSNEKYKQDLESFFKSKGLGFKIRERNKEVDPIEKLREIFGDKLIVK